MQLSVLSCLHVGYSAQVGAFHWSQRHGPTSTTARGCTTTNTFRHARCTADANASDRPFRLNMQRCNARCNAKVVERPTADTPPVIGPGGLGRRRKLRRLPPALELVSDCCQRPPPRPSHTPKPLPLAVPLKPPPPAYITAHYIRLVALRMAAASAQPSLSDSDSARVRQRKMECCGFCSKCDAAMREYFLSVQHATHSLQHATQHATCSARHRMLCSDCSIRYMVSLYFAVTTLTTVGCHAPHEHQRQL